MDSESRDEEFNKTVVVPLQRILARHCQTYEMGDMTSGVDGAATVNAPPANTDDNCPADNKMVRLWEGEALSHFRRSAWEGRSLATQIERLSCRCTSSLSWLSHQLMFSPFMFVIRCCLHLQKDP
jgi:hypothetical protein